MSLKSLLKQSVDVYRLANTTGSKKERSKVATIKIMIQPMSATTAKLADIAFVRAFQGFVLPTANVLIGDYLQDTNGNKYDVQGARDYNMGTQPYIELTLQKQTQQGQI
jgi:hypothetical protein